MYDVIDVKGGMPEWFVAGIESALKAPTAMNQQKFVPYNTGSGTTYFCYAGPDANLDVNISNDAGEDSLDRSESELEESLKFDEETGIDISMSDEIVKGPARIRQYSYSFSGMAAGGSGAFIYDTEKDVLIGINLMESGNGDQDYNGDFSKMIEDLAVEG